MALDDNERARIEAELRLTEESVTLYSDLHEDLCKEQDEIEFKLSRAQAHLAARIRERNRLKALLAA